VDSEGESEVEKSKPKKAARGKKPVYKEDADSEVDAPKPKKAVRGKKPVYKEDSENTASDVEAPKPKVKRAAKGKKAAAAADDGEKPTPQKRYRSMLTEPFNAKLTTYRGRKKKAAVESD
jgi:hypothetical protein